MKMSMSKMKKTLDHIDFLLSDCGEYSIKDDLLRMSLKKYRLVILDEIEIYGGNDE